MSHEHLDNWIDQIDWFHGDEYIRVIEAIDRDEDAGKCVLPRPENVLIPFTWFSPQDTRVVIINDEPLLSADHVTGLPLSVSPDCNDIPEVTQNVLSELYLDTGMRSPHGCLNRWARQGVLMLNLSMTVRENESGSHWNIGWQGLTDSVVKWVNRNTKNTVFMLWGQPAQAKRIHINRHHKVINCNSPKPETAHKGFFGSRPFSQTNDYLVEHNNHPISWYVL